MFRTTFLECAQKYWELLFATFGEEGREDDGEYIPSLSWYNTKTYIEWKKFIELHQKISKKGKEEVFGSEFDAYIRVFFFHISLIQCWDGCCMHII